MGQRLGLASALLGDPGTLLLDEPVNGLDPEGVLWIRNLLKSLAAEGRTVFVSSHLMSEMALTATQLIVIGRGRLVADLTVEDMVTRASRDLVRVRTPYAAQLAALIVGEDVTVESVGADELQVAGCDSASIGRLAADHTIPLVELTPLKATLEQAFMELTHDDVEYHASGSTGPTSPTTALAGSSL